MNVDGTSTRSQTGTSDSSIASNNNNSSAAGMNTLFMQLLVIEPHI